MLNKVTKYTYESLRSIVFLVVGLISLNFVQQTLIKKINNIWLMLIVLIADLIILYVINRQVLLKQKLNPKLRNSLIFVAVLLIFLVNVLR